MEAGARGPHGVYAFQSLSHMIMIGGQTLAAMRAWKTELEAAQAGAGEQIAQETAVKVSHVGQIDLILGTQ